MIGPARYGVTPGDPDHWRQCAAAARSEAENMNGEKKRLMLRIADDYDRLAERALEAN